MKNAKQWLAILLAVTLLCSNGVSQLAMTVSASELETTEEAQPKEEAVVEQEEETMEDTDKATAEEVTPEEERGESSVQDAETANAPKATAQEGVQEGHNEANVLEAAPATVAPTTATPATVTPATAVPASEGAGQQGEAAAPEVQTYNVKINKSELNGGQIKIWVSDNNKVDVTEYDGNNQYVKEVKEGEEFNFQITLNDGFEIAQVKVNGNAFDPANTEGNVITYKVAGINEEKVIDVTYNRVETPAEEKAAEEPKTEDETKVEEPAVENPTASAAVTATGEIMTDFYVKADRSSVTVGDTVNVKAIIKPDEFSDKRVTWESSDETIATVDENGLVTTRAIGTVRIIGKSEANPDMTDFDIITVNPIQVSKITITGYAKEYMLPNETVKLDATVEPDNAADKSVIWTSSDETIATVDQNGNVNALKQGEVTIRVAANDASGKYAEQKIKVYDAKPQEATVQVWVTNQYRGISYTINIPADGTEVNASDVIQKVDGYVSTNIIRVGTWESGSTWSTIQKTNPVQKFRYNNNRIQYTTNGYSWSNVSSNKIVAFYAIKTTAELGNTDVGVAVGDWPYGPGEATSHTKQTIRIKIVVDGSNNEIYNSGLLRYDNRSNGEYGKIEFDCDESRYEIKEILVYKNDSGTGTPLKTYTSVPTGGISVKFTDGGTNHYLVKAVVKPKEFDVTYDINGGEGKVPASTKLTAVDGQQVTVATSPQPTKEGYIFAGWEYDGTTYYGGESFEMPPHNVTFKAKWLKTSGVITYSSNNEEWGTVSRSYETLKDGATETRGSVAKANEGCVFTGWKNNQTGEIVSNELIYKPSAEPGSYTAVFKANINKYLELKTNDVTAKYDGKDYATGTATVKDKATGKVVDDVIIEYQKADGSWTTNPSEITATNVSDSKTVQVRATSEKYTGELTGTEELTITPKPVTVTANSYNKAYGAADPEFTAKVEGTLGSDTVNYKLNRETGEDVGTYKILAIGDAAQGNYSVTYYPGTLTITAATRPEDKQLSVTSYEGVYDANEHTITVDNVLDGDVVEYSYNDGETWKANLNQYKDVTETTIKVRVTNANYDPNPVELEGTVKITPATLTVSTPIATKVYEGTPLTAAGTISGFVNDETATFATTGSQTEVGSTANTYSLTWDGTAKESNYKVVETIGTLTVTAQSIDPDNPNYKGITVDAPTDVEYTGVDQTWLPTVTDGNGKALVKDTDYTVTYDNEDRTNVTGIITVTINGAGNYAGTITRTYQITPKPVTITTESKTRAFDGTALTAGGKVEGIVSGETYGFKTTGSQTYVGSSQNTYEMVWADSEVEGTSGTYTAKKTNYTVTESIGTLVVTAGTPENPLDPTLVVNKTHDKSQTYKAGDVITFTITAKNIYEEAKTITLEELEGVALDANVFENVAPGAEVTATATYTVTEQDIVNGTFTNNVTVTFSGVDDKFTGTDTVDELEDANPHMTITKTTVGAEEGHIYKLGEVINYKITATNDGNLTLTNVKVEDALTGNVGENAWTIDTLAPGEAQTFEASYTVTENDVLEGKVVNNATGTATNPTNPEKPDTPVTPGTKENPIETPNPSLTVVKTSDKTGVVKLGETITYTITVTNNGNVTINDIEVTDELTGNTGDNAFTIDRLAVGETKQFTATYTVTEDDILEGIIVNRATATGKDPRNEEVTGDGEVRVDTEEKDDSKKDDSKKDDSKKNDSDKKPGAVKTGDATDVIPFFGMTVLAAGAAIVIALKKKRRA